MLHLLIESNIVGLAIGVFCPSIARKLHTLFSKEVKQGAVLAEVAVQDVKKKL